MTKILPHDSYIDAVVDALHAAGFDPESKWTSEAETAGLHCYLSGVIELSAHSGIDTDRLRHGLLLRWEWHTGIEAADGEPENGPVWLWAKKRADGSDEPAVLTAEGYASPDTIVDLARNLDGHAVPVTVTRWEHADTLDAACEAWGAKEAGQ